MTSPASSPDAIADARRFMTPSVVVLLVVIALKTFALGASGSVSVLASLADSTLTLIAGLATVVAVRWSVRGGNETPGMRARAEAMAALMQAGLVFASAVFIGWEAIERIFVPRPVTGGGWAVGVMLIVIALTGWMAWRQARATQSETAPLDRTPYVADMAASVVVLIGLVSGAFLKAPGLDATAGLVVMVWLFWGAASTLKDAAERLTGPGTDTDDRDADVVL